MTVVVNIADREKCVKGNFWYHKLTTQAHSVYDWTMMKNRTVIETTTNDINDYVLRTITYEITDSKSGKKISRFLKEKGYSEQNLVNLKKDEQSIWVNGSCVHQNYVLNKGDSLEVCIREKDSSEGIVPVKMPLSIVYEDEDLFVINKPAGMPIHPSRNNPENSLGNALAWHMKERGMPFVFRCINRLDRDTSGLTIVAKHMVSGAILSRMVAAKSRNGLTANGIHREYLAVVQGKLESVEGTIDAPIARKEGVCLERVVDFVHGERAVTHYQVIEEENGYSLVLLKLETGRTHQIRVHMKYLGHPLVGDFLYNPKYAGNQIDRVEECSGCLENYSETSQYEINRQALHAYRLCFPHPMTGSLMEFTSPLPEDMHRLINETAGL